MQVADGPDGDVYLPTTYPPTTMETATAMTDALARIGLTYADVDGWFASWDSAVFCATAPCRHGARNDPGRSTRDPDSGRRGARDLDGYHAAGA